MPTKELSKIHPAGPIVWAAIVVVLFYLYNKGARIPAMPDAGLGQSVRYNYPTGQSTDMLYPFSDEAPAQHIALNPYRSATEPFPKQPVVNQDGRRVPWYQFLNEMFHSQSNAYLQERAYP
jgi:hypothetical protein